MLSQKPLKKESIQERLLEESINIILEYNIKKISGDMVAQANSGITSLGILGPFFEIA